MDTLSGGRRRRRGAGVEKEQFIDMLKKLREFQQKSREGIGHTIVAGRKIESVSSLAAISVVWFLAWVFRRQGQSMREELRRKETVEINKF